MWLRIGGGQESLVYCNIFVQAARCTTGVLGGSGSGGHGGGGYQSDDFGTRRRISRLRATDYMLSYNLELVETYFSVSS